MYLLYSLIALILGFFLDLLLGDPYNMPHPIRMIGTFISKTEQGLRHLFRLPITNQYPQILENSQVSELTQESHSIKRELLAGIFLWLIVVSISTLLPLMCLILCYRLHFLAGIFLESIFCYYMLAAKCLKTESIKVANALKQGDVEQARTAVSMIVGRDTERLSKEGIAKAAVETVAENTSDGVIAPFLFMLCFGSTGGFFYKAANTLDSMVGYRNNTYLYLGRFSAYMDDIFNFIPARISAGLMIITAGILELLQKILKIEHKIETAPCTGTKLHWWFRFVRITKDEYDIFIPWSAGNALRIFLRDRFQHSSPNSAQTESVCAGAMQITLAGDAWYFGKKYEKPTIGDGTNPVTWQHIFASCHLLYGSAWLCLLIGCGIKLFLIWLL